MPAEPRRISVREYWHKVFVLNKQNTSHQTECHKGQQRHEADNLLHDGDVGVHCEGGRRVHDAELSQWPRTDALTK